MKPNPKNRYNGRYNNRNTRTVITRNTALESTGPNGKLHGTALQLIEKYQAAAKDALIQNDLVLAQTCLQYADHYTRIQNIAIANDMAMRNQQQGNMNGNSVRSNEDGETIPEQENTTDELPTFTAPTEVKSEETEGITADTSDIEEMVDTVVNAQEQPSDESKRNNGRRTLQMRRSAQKKTDKSSNDNKKTTDLAAETDTPIAQSEKTEKTGPVVVRRRGPRSKTTSEAVA